MKYKDWQILNRFPDDIIGEILKSRKISDRDTYFNPNYKSLSDPFAFSGMKKAVERVKHAIEAKERIGLFMDYDADGICGGAVIFKTLSKFINIDYYIPHRHEGYGLNNGALDYFKKSGDKLVLTVDCGIKNNKEIDYANKLGLEVIVIDHHELSEDLPKAYEIIHPKISKNLKFKNFSGGGVAYNFVRGLNLSGEQEKWDIELAAISTVADIVPLIEDNRTIVHFGLNVLNRTRNMGLKKMIEVAGIKEGGIGTYEIGFQIAPRINATGRIDDPVSSFKLLIESDRKEVGVLAQKLQSLNLERQDVLEKSLEEAEKIIEKEMLYHENIIIVKSDSFNEGVVGLVAGKISDKYYRPSIVLTSHDGFWKGSARSITGVDITRVITVAEKYLRSFGGHPGAAGLSLTRENLEKFIKIIAKEALKIDPKLFERKLVIDALVHPAEVNLNLAKKIAKMEPFGYGNKKPIFALTDLKISSLRFVGKNSDHLKLSLCTSDSVHECMLFFAKKNGFEGEVGKTVDVAFSLNVNTWNNREKVDLIIEDIK